MYPALTVVLDHIACPSGFDDSAFEDWKENISRLVPCKNVVVKISGLCHPFFVGMPSSEGIIRFAKINK
jgi:predicted TIM-barrel fold metal-dependent hydrolase